MPKLPYARLSVSFMQFPHLITMHPAVQVLADPPVFVQPQVSAEPLVGFDLYSCCPPPLISSWVNPEPVMGTTPSATAPMPTSFEAETLPDVTAEGGVLEVLPPVPDVSI